MALSEHAAAAKMIRQEIKSHGIKARVNASSASMTNSVDIYLENEMPATRAAVAEFCGKFQYGHFDGMTDCYECSNTNKDLPQVKHVFVHNDYSDEIRQAAWEYVCSHWAGMEGAPESHKDAHSFRSEDAHMWGDMLINRTLSEARGGFWLEQKRNNYLICRQVAA